MSLRRAHAARTTRSRGKPGADFNFLVDDPPLQPLAESKFADRKFPVRTAHGSFEGTPVMERPMHLFAGIRIAIQQRQQAYGFALLGELTSPSWRTLLQETVTVEADYALRNRLPGFLSESYTGDGVQYTPCCF